MGLLWSERTCVIFIVAWRRGQALLLRDGSFDFFLRLLIFIAGLRTTLRREQRTIDGRFARFVVSAKVIYRIGLIVFHCG